LCDFFGQTFFAISIDFQRVSVCYWTRFFHWNIFHLFESFSYKHHVEVMKVQVNMTFQTDRNMNDFRKKSITMLWLYKWRISVALAADDFHSCFLWVFAITFKRKEIFGRHFICNISVNMLKTSSQRKTHATFLLRFDFAEDELLSEFALDIFYKNSGSEPRAFSFAIPAATMTAA